MLYPWKTFSRLNGKTLQGFNGLSEKQYDCNYFKKQNKTRILTNKKIGIPHCHHVKKT